MDFLKGLVVILIGWHFKEIMETWAYSLGPARFLIGIGVLMCLISVYNWYKKLS